MGRGFKATFLLLVGGLGTTAQKPPPLTETWEIPALGMTLRHPASWSVFPSSYRNLFELRNVPAAQQGSPAAASAARLQITWETRRDHQEAVRRLREIAEEVRSPSTFLTIGGWPALQRRHAAPLPQTGAAAGPPPMALTVTTAIAAGVVLIRLEGVLGPDASPRLAEEVETICRSATFTRGPDRGQGGNALEQLLRTQCGPPQQGGRVRWCPLLEPGSGGALTAVAVSPHQPAMVLLAGDMLGVAFSQDRGEHWEITTGFASWEAGEFTFHPLYPNEIWVGTMSGPYLSRDWGRTWEAHRNGFPEPSGSHYSAPVQKVLFDPEGGNRLLAFGGSHRRWNSPGSSAWGAVWESQDGGDGWRRIATIAGGRNVVAACAAARPGAFFAAVDERGIFRSLDGGHTWEPAGDGLSSPNVNWVACHPTEPDVLWVALDAWRDRDGMAPGGIYKTEDGGATWRISSTGLPQRRGADANDTSRYFTVVAAPSDPDRLYTSDCGWPTSSIWRSDDGGATWRVILNAELKKRVPTAYVPGPAARVLAVDPGNPDVVFAANTEYVLRSLDGGATWSDATSLALAADPARWRGRGFSGLVAVNLRFDPAWAGRAALLAMDDGKFWHSDDHLQSWAWGGMGLPHWGGGNDVAFAGQILYATFGQAGRFQGIGRSRDGGRTWVLLAGAERGLPALEASGEQPLGIHALPSRPEAVWATVGGRLYRSADSGESWQAVHQGPGLGWIESDPRRPLTFYVSGALGVYKTTHGESFQLLPGGPANVTRIAVDPLSPEVIYATQWRGEPGGLWAFRDGLWKRLHQDRYIFHVAADPFQPGRLAAITADDPYHDESFAGGVWWSEDAGATWTRENEGLAVLRGSVLRFDPHLPGRVVLGTRGRGFFVGFVSAAGAP